MVFSKPVTVWYDGSDFGGVTPIGTPCKNIDVLLRQLIYQILTNDVKTAILGMGCSGRDELDRRRQGRKGKNSKRVVQGISR